MAPARLPALGHLLHCIGVTLSAACVRIGVRFADAITVFPPPAPAPAPAPAVAPAAAVAPVIDRSALRYSSAVQRCAAGSERIHLAHLLATSLVRQSIDVRAAVVAVASRRSHPNVVDCGCAHTVMATSPSVYFSVSSATNRAAARYAPYAHKAFALMKSSLLLGLGKNTNHSLLLVTDAMH